MLLSELILEAQTMLAEHGDVDVLSHNDYHITDLSFEKATQGQLEFWGMNTEEEYVYVKINDDD